MTEQKFISHAQNAEDVVLYRALGHLTAGRYVEIGANDPDQDSITRAFYDRGWHGLEVEPVTEFAERFRRARPRDVVVQAAVTSDEVDSVAIHVIDGTGLSTLDDEVDARHATHGWTSHTEQVPARRLDSLVTEHGFADDVHFLVVDVEGAERSVLESVDLHTWRPWVLVIEATSPLTNALTHEQWEGMVVGAGYEFCLFDGLSRFYVASEHAAVLRETLSRPASALDEFRTHREQNTQDLLTQRQALITALEADRNALTTELIRWRGRALEKWASALDEAENDPYAAAGTGREIARLKAELEATKATLSWRVTRPLRVARSRQLGGRR